MAILELEETKKWLRIDDDEDDIVGILIGAAEIYLYNAIEFRPDGTNALAKLFCLVLCADWYENRDLIGQQPSDKVRFTVQSIMAQLQYGYTNDAPTVPSDLVGIAGDQSVALTWTVDDADTRYNVYQNSTKITPVPIYENEYEATGLTNGTIYSFQISAVGKNNKESKKTDAVELTPTA